MHDYMKALYHRFDSPTERIELLEEQTDRIYKKLVKQLGKQQKRLLLQLVDLENALQDQACLNSFMSGYRLAHGIHQELLADQPPYNFEDEDERLACERLRREEDSHGQTTRKWRRQYPETGRRSMGRSIHSRHRLRYW